MMNQQEASEYKHVNEDKVLDDFFKDVNIDDDDMCSMNNLTIQNNVINIESEDDEKGNTYDPGF